MNDILRSFLDQAFGSGLFDGVTDILTMNPQTKFPTAWSIMTTVYDNVMVPLGIGIMLIWFICAFLEKTTHEDFTFEKWFFEFGKLVACQYLIIHGLELLALFMSMGLSLFNQIQTLSVSSLTNPTNLSHTAWRIITGKDWSENLGILQAFGYMVIFLLPVLGSLIAQIIIKVIAYSRLFELFLRGAMAPLALSDFFGQGMQGAGFKFLKNFFAVAIQGIVIYVVLLLLSVIMIDVLATQVDETLGMFAFLGIYFAVLFAAVSLILKSLSFAKELVGAQ